jgi:hypothetical protein
MQNLLDVLITVDKNEDATGANILNHDKSNITARRIKTLRVSTGIG